jgi:ribokinase
MPHNFDIVCVGDAKIDIFLTLHQTREHLRYMEKTNELCIKFGEKVIVDKAEMLVGGDATNVAVGASRLGLNTAIVAEIGKDEFAQKIINTLKNENVNIENISESEGQQSSFSTIINYKGERTIFSEHVKREHNFNFSNVLTKWVYLTSLGENWLNAYSRAADFVKETKCNLAFNPGTLQIANKENIKNILLIANLLLVNKEEAEEILGLPYGQKNIEELIIGLQKLGPKIVVITDGKNGSFAASSEGDILNEKIVKVEVVEKTGAGDAYSSGFISALMNNKSIAEAMFWGAKNSASVITKVGAQAGLLCKADFEKI